MPCSHELFTQWVMKIVVGEDVEEWLGGCIDGFVDEFMDDQVSSRSNAALLPFRRLGIFVLSIHAPYLTQLYQTITEAGS